MNRALLRQFGQLGSFPRRRISFLNYTRQREFCSQNHSLMLRFTTELTQEFASISALCGTSSQFSGSAANCQTRIVRSCRVLGLLT